MSLLVYLDGKLVPKEEAKISIFDHGLLYGDGIFEGIRSYNGRVFKLEEHLKRLSDSAKAINLNIPLSLKELKEAVLLTLRSNNLKNAYIRLVVTRGVGDLGLDPQKCPQPTIFIITDKIVLYSEEFYEHGLEIITVPTRRNIPEAVNPCIKSLNYLNNILAKIEATNAGFLEAVMLNSDGLVTECTGENIFIVKDSCLVTPPCWVGALRGITREVVLDLSLKLKIEAKEDVLTRYDLYTAEEMFLTGTAAEIIPIITVDGRMIGNGKPGKITTSLRNAFTELTQNEGTVVA
ncbi:branched-chain-amino-acid transaminase [bacterium]|nr:branched-chain-amino-acid transaminase [bacterium]MBU0899922.1 branched-chain-amino-acid transaminase [bacterium]MBU1152700.1 branched-chain-amino-acid transaminase [bacterium]